jgi:carboxyl-terminal processing protease
MSAPKYSLSIAVILFAAILGSAPLSPRAELTADEVRKNLESFEYIWRTIRDQHFDPNLNGVDWKAAYDEIRPDVENAETMQDARAAMRALIAKLGQSHFNIIASEAYRNIDAPAGKGDLGGTTGITVRVLDGEAVVVSVLPESPAARESVRPGWIIRRIGETDVPSLFPAIEEEFASSPRRELYLARSVENRMHGAIGDTVTVSFLDGSDRTIEKIFVLEEEKGKKVVFGHFPPFYLRTETKTLNGGIGYFAFSVFFDPLTLMPAYNAAMQSFIRAPGIIIDIRGNPGGIGAIPIGMAGWFVDEKNLDIGTMRTRDNTLRFVVNPRARAYRGPVAVLVDGCSGSSAEIFAGGVQGLPRVRIFGTRTVGATLPSIAERLPNGDGFQYATASYIASDGTELEGTGVIPDTEVRLTRDALLAARDPVIEAAIDWIERQEYKGGK